MQPRPFAIGIAGGSGSGKTQLARALVDSLGRERCSVLDHDSYYRDLSHLPAEARAATNFDHPDSLDNALLAEQVRSLLAGRSVARPVYDFRTHTRTSASEPVAARAVVVCEGILLLSVPELRHSFDLRVFVDTPADVRAMRRVQRDIVERGRSVTSVVGQYLTSVRPMHERFVEPARQTADLVLDWRRSSEQQAELVLAAMRRAGAAADATGSCEA